MSLADSASDEDAVRAVLDGDVDSFALLVRRYERRVYRVGFGFLKDPDEAADFAQDVFIKAYTHLGSFRFGARFSTWLTRIAYNEGINLFRRARRYESLGDPDLFAGADDVPGAYDKAEAAKALGEAMSGLPPKWSLCLDLFFFCGLSYAEMEEVTGMPVNTIKSHVFRAKRALREKLEEGSHEPR